MAESGWGQSGRGADVSCLLLMLNIHDELYFHSEPQNLVLVLNSQYCGKWNRQSEMVTLTLGQAAQ